MGIYDEPGGYTMEQMAELNRQLGVQTVIPRVPAIPRPVEDPILRYDSRIGVINAGQEELEPPDLAGVVQLANGVVSPDWSYTPPAANGVFTPGQETDGVMATPMVLPAIAAIGGVAAIAGRFMTLAVFKRLLITFGRKILIGLVGLAAFKEFMDMIGVGAPDDSQVKIKAPGGKKRYSIGSNPRVRTLAKVSGHCKRLLKRHEKVIRAFLPKPTKTYGIPPGKALSAIERAAIKG